MAYTYATAPSDVAVNKSTGTPAVGIRIRVFTDQGGQQITAGLRDLDGNVLPGHIETDAEGRFPFTDDAERPYALWALTPGGDWFCLVANELRDNVGQVLDQFPIVSGKADTALEAVEEFRPRLAATEQRAMTADEKADHAIEVAEAIDAGSPAGLEGVSIFSYGHSWTRIPAIYSSPGGEYQNRICKRINAGRVQSYGRSGTVMPEIALSSWVPDYGGKKTEFKQGDTGIVIVHGLMNDAIHNGYDAGSARGQLLFEDSLRSLLAAVSCRKRVAANGYTESGTWDDGAGGAATTGIWFPGGIMRRAVGASATSAYLQTTVTGDSCYIWGLRVPDSTTTQGRWKVTCNGTDVATFANNTRFLAYDGMVVGARNNQPTAMRVTGLNDIAGTSGSKTIRVQPTEAKNTYVGACMYDQSSSPLVLLCTEPPRPTPHTNYDTTHPILVGICEQVAQEFPNVHMVDLSIGWDSATMYGSPENAEVKGSGALTHPNDLGMRHCADTLHGVIRDLVPGPELGVLSV